MLFNSASKVSDVIRASDQVERVRAENRIKILNQANGFPPLSADQAKKMGVRVNVNFGEMVVLFAHARRQMVEALLNPRNFFKVTIPLAPEEKKGSWGTFITNWINRKMKDSDEYASLKENQLAAVVAHGIGPQLWCDNEHWMPEFVAIEDFRVPTDTETSFRRLPWIAVRKNYTEGELAKKVFGEYADKHWEKKVIKKILHEYHDVNFETESYTWMTAPEKMAELVKQNAGFYSSDAVPTIPLWHFYYMDDSSPSKPCIKLKIVPDQGVRGTESGDQQFLYDCGDDYICHKWPELVSVQYGDLNNKSPFMHHAVRSLGFLLMEPCFWTNIFRCRLLQHGMENFNVWIRIADPEGRSRAQKVELFDKGVVPEGVTIVPNTERHQVDGEMVNNIMAQLKQLQGEASQSYTQQLDTGTKKEQTAFETRAKIASVNAMMGSILSRMFRKESFAYREICRRFCIRKSTDQDVRDFQEACRREGIPKQYLNVEYWDVEPEIPIGSGNATMAESEIMTLMEWRPMFNPTAQQEILHEAVEVITHDPRRAERWAPIDGKRGVSEAQRDAESVFGTLMQGVPVRIKDGLNPIDQVETLLGLLAGVVVQIERGGNMTTMREIAGLQNVGKYVSQLVQQIAQDENEKARVKSYSDAMGKLMNSVKAFAQRLQEQMQKESQNGDGDAKAKAAATMMQAQVKAEIDRQLAQQTQGLEQKRFELDQQREDQSLMAELARKQAENDADIERKNKLAEAKAKNAPNGKPEDQ